MKKMTHVFGTLFFVSTSDLHHHHHHFSEVRCNFFLFSIKSFGKTLFLKKKDQDIYCHLYVKGRRSACVKRYSSSVSKEKEEKTTITLLQLKKYFTRIFVPMASSFEKKA